MLMREKWVVGKGNNQDTLILMVLFIYIYSVTPNLSVKHTSFKITLTNVVTQGVSVGQWDGGWRWAVVISAAACYVATWQHTHHTHGEMGGWGGRGWERLVGWSAQLYHRLWGKPTPQLTPVYLTALLTMKQLQKQFSERKYAKICK